MTDTGWYKACANSSCLEVCPIPDGVLIRVTGGPGILYADWQEWDAFIAAAGEGKFDQLRAQMP